MTPAEQPRRADADRRRRQGVRRHLRQHRLAGAAAWRRHLGALRRSEVAARPPAGGDARLSQAWMARPVRRRRSARARSLDRARCRRWRRTRGDDGSVHRAALHLLPQLRVGDCRAGARAGIACTWPPIARTRWRPSARGPARRATRRHGDGRRHADPRVGPLPPPVGRAAARARLPALLGRAVRRQCRRSAQRAYDRTPAFVLALARLPLRPAGDAAALERLEEAVPRQAGVDEFVRAQRAGPAAHHPAHRARIAAARLRARGAARWASARALCVWSWDHLSSKALIRVRARRGDRLERDRSARRRRASTASPPSGCSSPARSASTAGSTASRRATATTFCRARRAAGRPAVPALRLLGALHGQPVRGRLRARMGGRPSGARRTRALSGMRAAGAAAPAAARGVAPTIGRRCAERGAVWGSNPVDDDGRADYFDSLYHASAVVGLNTSALVEAAIVDRPVFTMLLPEFRDNQEGTFHFHHLLTVGDGFLQRGAFARRARRAAGGAARRTVPQRPNGPFVEQFIRPRGARWRPRRSSSKRSRGLADAGPRPAPADAGLGPARCVRWCTLWCWRAACPSERIYWNPVKRREWARKDSTPVNTPRAGLIRP